MIKDYSRNIHKAWRTFSNSETVSQQKLFVSKRISTSHKMNAWVWKPTRIRRINFSSFAQLSLSVQIEKNNSELCWLINLVLTQIMEYIVEEILQRNFIRFCAYSMFWCLLQFSSKLDCMRDRKPKTEASNYGTTSENWFMILYHLI